MPLARVPGHLATVDAAVRVLERFDADRSEWTLSELARALGQPTSTVNAQLVTLTGSGLLTKIGRGRYRLGWRLLKLSSALYGSLPWYGPAHDAVERVARGTHLLAFLCVLEGERVICVARSGQGRDPARVMGETQFELPAHATASGKLLLAHAGRDLPANAAAFTPRTVTGAKAWAQQVQAVRASGHAQSVDEWAEGTSALAVPLRGAGGEVLAALGVSLPTARLRSRERLLRTLHDAADAVAWDLGHRPGSA